MKRIRKQVQHYSSLEHEMENNKRKKIQASFDPIVISPKANDIPIKNSNGQLVFPDFPDFKPNLTPKEILLLGSFGGTYFRPIYSSITQESYKDQWKEFPKDWFEGLDIKKQVTSIHYDVNVNKFKESCGGDLEMWESSGWIRECDPYGWFQWYCRFYLGRRCSDDARQVQRGLGVMGPKGRWRNNLTNKCLASSLPAEEAWNNPRISPKIRQLLQHWGYQLTLHDLKLALKKK